MRTTISEIRLGFTQLTDNLWQNKWFMDVKKLIWQEEFPPHPQPFSHSLRGGEGSHWEARLALFADLKVKLDKLLAPKLNWVTGIVLILFVLCAGCIPVEKPPQLTFTPGAAFVVTGETFDAGVFHVQYPADWRVITGQASAPPSVIFAAPEDQALMMLAVGAIESPPVLNTDVETRSETRSLEHDDLMLTAYLTAPVAEWDRYVQVFETVLASVSD